MEKCLIKKNGLDMGRKSNAPSNITTCLQSRRTHKTSVKAQAGNEDPCKDPATPESKGSEAEPPGFA